MFTSAFMVVLGRYSSSLFYFAHRYTDDVLSIDNPEFKNYLGQMYTIELEIKDTTESNTSASDLDLLLSTGKDRQLLPSIYEKRYNFNFNRTNFPFMSRNIPSSLTYNVLISELIRYAKACSLHEWFILSATYATFK